MKVVGGNEDMVSRGRRLNLNLIIGLENEKEYCITSKFNGLGKPPC
jgi:hypothetical protein